MHVRDCMTAPVQVIGPDTPAGERRLPWSAHSARNEQG
jgi:hypothetical protein